MKDELARFALKRLRERGFSGRGATLRVIGSDLQWVAQVEKVGHVDQVNVELGIVFATEPPGNRVQCRVLWSLANVPGVESDDVARAFMPTAGYSLEEREGLVGDALDTAAEFVQAHLSRDDLATAYREGNFGRAFVFKEAKDLLEAT